MNFVFKMMNFVFKMMILIQTSRTFVAPFLISIVPMRMFVDWDEFEPVREVPII